MTQASIIVEGGAARSGAEESSVRGEALFEHAPPMGIQRRLGLIGPDKLHVTRRAALAASIGWVPLVLLTLAQAGLSGGNGIDSLLKEAGVHARYLIAVPLLIVAEGQCARFLGGTVRGFVHSGMVPDTQRNEFERAIASTGRLLSSTAVEVGVFALAYLVVALTAASSPIDQLPAWHRSADGTHSYSAAGWWHVLVSMPLLLVVILGWLWRLALWTRLLWIVSRLDLRLIASHPDHVAGLGFVGHSLRAFSIVAFALAAIAAGRSAHIVLLGGKLPTPNLLFNAVFLGVLVVVFVAPFLVFSAPLLRTWQRGTAEYGALAGLIGGAFEGKWLGRDAVADREALERPDFSATTDLYSVAANVYAMRFVPVDSKDLIAFATALLLPFVPVVLLVMPLEVILSGVKKLMF